jgi:hypothetical protein
MRRSAGLAAIALVLGLAATVMAGDVAGTWTAEFDTQVGPQKYSYTFEKDGETLTGKATAERMGETVDVELKDVELDGDKLSFVETLSFQGQEIPITYSGTLQGDEIKLTRQVGDFATEELVAKRKTE